MNNSIGNKIAAFHIGRGGKFNNPGFMKFLGLRDLTSFSSFICLSEGEVFDNAGNALEISEEKYLTGIGKLDFDGDYDTIICKMVDDIDDKEMAAVFKSDDFYREDILEYHADL